MRLWSVRGFKSTAAIGFGGVILPWCVMSVKGRKGFAVPRLIMLFSRSARWPVQVTRITA